jgi:hypothetical protein
LPQDSTVACLKRFLDASCQRGGTTSSRVFSSRCHEMNSMKFANPASPWLTWQSAISKVSGCVVTELRPGQVRMANGGSGWTNQTSPWPEKPLFKNGLVLLSLARRKRDMGAAALRGARM